MLIDPEVSTIRTKRGLIGAANEAVVDNKRAKLRQATIDLIA
jgi:hypothetical protein